MARTTIISALALVLMVEISARADDLFYVYEGDVIPSAADGWLGDFCAPPCTASIEDGRLNYRWPQGGDFVYIGQLYFDPPPPSLWAEWRFRSNRVKPINFYTCDASFSISFRAIHEVVFMFADAGVSFSGNDIASGLNPTEFHSYRFESPDGMNYTVSVDGMVFIENIDTTGLAPIAFSFGGDGGCFIPMQERINEWDFLRVGTLSSGELIVATDPPTGFLDPTLHAGLDRFTVTFDAPSYAYIDDITVEVTGGIAPQVLQTRRLDNGAPEVLEVVLDRPIPLGHTTRFTFDDGTLTNVVEFTLGVSGACCNPQGTCADGVDPNCTDSGNLFVPDQTCSDPVPCCFPLGLCRMLDPVCCAAIGHTVTAGTSCGGDVDADGVDALCGDECPADPAKLTPGLCGCGLSDTADSDHDTIQDCFDQCPGADDRIFVPGCVAAIPTASHWGVIIIALGLLCVAKVAFGRRETSAGM